MGHSPWYGLVFTSYGKIIFHLNEGDHTVILHRMYFTLGMSVALTMLSSINSYVVRMWLYSMVCLVF